MVPVKRFAYSDSLHESLDLEEIGAIYFPDKCIKTYCSDEHSERYLKKLKQETTDASSATARIRWSEVKDFIWKMHCTFCAETCSINRDKKNSSTWREAYEC